MVPPVFRRHCEEQSDEAIQNREALLDCFAALAMTRAFAARSLVRLCPRAGGGGACCYPVEQRDHILDFGAVEPLGDKDDLAAAVGVRPVLEPRQIMQQMLRALDHGRTVRLLGDVHDAFHSQQVRSEILLQGIEQQPQRLARDRLLADKAERGDIAVVQVVMVVIRVIVVMIVRCSSTCS